MANALRLISLLALIGLTACATTVTPLPKMLGPQAAGVGISIRIHSALRSQEPDAAYFVRVDDRDNVFGLYTLRSNYAKGHNAYLLNAKPGLYAVVAASYTQSLPGLSIDRVAYFPEDLIRKTIVEVKPGTLSYMGTFEVDMAAMAGFRSADRAQEYYRAKVGTSPVNTFQSMEKKSMREPASEEKFYEKAREDFSESEWSRILR